MTKIEKIAKLNITHAINWIVGGYLNSIEDGGDIEDLPKSYQDLKDEIYYSCINDLYGEGYMQAGYAPKEMRFAGVVFIKDTISKLCDSDGDVQFIAKYLSWSDFKGGF